MSNPIPPHAKRVFKGEIFEVYQWEQEMFDGTFHTFEKLKRPDVAIVIPVDREGKILIEYQDQPNNPGLISTPAGRLEPDEDPLVGAKRELLEETGYTSARWEKLFETSPNEKIASTLHYYIAHDCIKTQEPHLDAGEKIVVKEVGFDEFVQLATAEGYRDREISLYLLRLMREQSKLTEFRQRLGL